ncbi:serine/threonine protein kinase [Lactobacillus nasalidis]|uniref:non-specific serine/threonine protein kinase n=1 Tax=Lactobacillus nasalidis TaxID=2797258 RepID=A0ABQ3W8G5_9LACO|nr:Stk1 family PASTA domain-containing Ser/Thr kinase [Lactobacillus nasalidis]GHV97768.1 serine/threonine protein kinase [Lactobacillus nasalidis]GHW00237.1 serine/threonine protein kinase [Lactobacillus nasalidis]GHW01650.1 serine/threonine protein kinase [Lactobacillus nasalidis]
MINKGYLLGDRYRIVDTLGEGGMANVYLADDIILKRQVAVKIIRLDLQKDSQVLARFQREALATSELSHPNIVSVFDVGTDHGLPYMVMEYVKGPDLKDYIRENSPIPLPKVIKIMDQILSAMELAHKHNVIHRDLKPQNILMDEKGNIKIADFGIAVALNQSAITQTNSVLGSVHYMSPEQTRGGMVTKQSDIYSLGIILYEALTGHVPFNGETPVAIALKHAEDDIPSLRKQNKAIPQALENVVLKATAKDPRDRYASVAEMKADLDSSLDPSRAGEAVYQPSHGNNDETKILPALNGKVMQAEKKQADQAEQPKKRSLWANIKKYKWWWIGSIFPIFAILLFMFFAVGHNNVRVPNVVNMTEQAAKTSLKSAGLAVGAVKRTYSSDVKKGKVISTTPKADSAVDKGRKVSLLVSRGPVLTKVPDVEGLYLATAKKKLTKLGFKVKSKEAPSNEYVPGLVISQSIKSGRKVDATKTTITLVVAVALEDQPKATSQSSKASFKLADLAGKSLEDAQSYAKSKKLTVKVEKDYSDSVASGKVISTDPAAGTEVSEGDTLTVTVSQGAEKKEVKKTYTVDYQAESSSSSSSDSSDDSSSESASSSSTQGNHVRIYIQDDNHSLGNIYRDQYITKDTDFTITFSVSKGAGKIKIVRDDETVVDETVTADDSESGD